MEGHYSLNVQRDGFAINRRDGGQYGGTRTGWRR